MNEKIILNKLKELNINLNGTLQREVKNIPLMSTTIYNITSKNTFISYKISKGLSASVLNKNISVNIRSKVIYPHSFKIILNNSLFNFLKNRLKFKLIENKKSLSSIRILEFIDTIDFQGVRLFSIECFDNVFRFNFKTHYLESAEKTIDLIMFIFAELVVQE